MMTRAKPERSILMGIDPELKLATRGDLPAIVERLAARPEFLNAMSDGHHRTLLWEAANANRLEVVEYLLSLGVDADIPGRYRSETFVLLTPYCIARKRKRMEIAQLLLANGAELDVYSASFLGELAVLEGLVSRDPSLVTALHAAAKAGFSSVIQILLDAGADVSALTDKGETPLDLAIKNKRIEASAILENSGAT